MKVLLINGSPHQFGCTFTALKEMSDELNKEGVETEIIWLGTKAIHDCIACHTCSKTNKCVFNDDLVNETIEKLDEIDGIVVGSPVYYAGPTSNLCAFLDRLFYACHKDLTGKLGASVVSCRRGGATAAFDRLNKYFTIVNMPIVSSQYWNMVHGYTPEDVKKDEEGLQTMRTLAQNMAWLLKCIKVGEENGVKKPVHEKKINTNFIR